jgi:hypothetical protein
MLSKIRALPSLHRIGGSDRRRSEDVQRRRWHLMAVSSPALAALAWDVHMPGNF